MEYELNTAEGHNADEWGQYRSLSSLSVVAFVLGLCSVVTFASPLMIVVPLAAAAIALLAMKGITASAGGLSGTRLASCGLALAIFFSVASFARVEVRTRLLQRQADHVGRQWLSMAAEGRVEGMLELMSKAAAQKLMPPAEGTQPMPFLDGIFASAKMRQDPLVARLAELQGSGELSWQLQEASILASSAAPQAVFRYVAWNDHAEQPCSLVLKRFQTNQLDQIWLIDSWALD